MLIRHSACPTSQERNPTSLYRMRALLRAHMLRRTKRDACVARQIALPPVEWRTIELELEAAERAAYESALGELRVAHRNFAEAESSAVRERRREERELREEQQEHFWEARGGNVFGMARPRQRRGDRDEPDDDDEDWRAADVGRGAGGAALGGGAEAARDKARALGRYIRPLPGMRASACKLAHMPATSELHSATYPAT